jgi:hypothetical protein
MSWYDGKPEDGLLWYPRSDDTPSFIRVELADVRAADNLIISYDFDRDGYSIARETDPETEVSFIRSWKDYEKVDAANLRALAYREVAESMNIFRRLKNTYPERMTAEEEELWREWGGSLDGFYRWLLRSADIIEEEGKVND